MLRCSNNSRKDSSWGIITSKANTYILRANVNDKGLVPALIIGCVLVTVASTPYVSPRFGTYVV